MHSIAEQGEAMSVCLHVYEQTLNLRFVDNSYVTANIKTLSQFNVLRGFSQIWSHMDEKHYYSI